ncbi:hypothetical protein B9Z55_009766 [Caenorhabditis nigoni]|uniref:HIT-type domain-containing protein n=1 Tax=Caenorhabditis nigoni TaxID=1611254 RepID=A0A2G5UTH9_9PELO|nr:hypothetical protein B9Z55_009766 [Caenorhabditis nigoni]
MNPDFGDAPDPRAITDGPGLCQICGCAAAKKCGKCQVARYCSQAHQVVETATEGFIAEKLQNPRNAFVFKEFEGGIEQEYMPANLFDGISDDEDDDDEEDGNREDETEEEKKARMKEFEKFVKENRDKKR